MYMDEILKNTVHQNQLPPLSDIQIEGIAINSTSVSQNDLFIAIPGHKYDGHQFIKDAIAAGACAIIGEKDMNPLAVPYFKVNNSRLALAEIAREFYQTDTSKQIVIGVTGTNGKTTTSFMLKKILEDAGYSCALFGTVHNVINGKIIPSKNTTVDPLELHKYLSTCKDDIIIIEVSSHGLSQHRLDGVEFDYCLFTNLDHEHLDYHRNMEEYFSVKASLFNKLKEEGKAIINAYNPWGKKLKQLIDKQETNIFTLGEDIQITECKEEDFTVGLILENGKNYKITLSLFGEHNLYNATMAFLTARQFGISAQQIIRSLQTFNKVPGRFEIFRHPIGAQIIVDYAHTADAFLHILTTAKKRGATRITHIFGFRGNRDESKREGMYKMSLKISDQIILTFDDLNETTTDEMERSLESLNTHPKSIVIPDRTLAIQHAIQHAQQGEWIFITGKGMEAYQQQYTLPVTSDDAAVHFILENYRK